VLPVSRTSPAANGAADPIPGQLTLEQVRG
jgi:hypothetical protein